MAITSAFPRALKLALLTDLATDVYKVALYGTTADLGVATAAYTSVGEIVDPGYTAGGNLVTISPGFPQIDTAGRAIMRFNTVSWNSLAITQRVAGGLIYNVTRANLAVRVFNFGQPIVPSGGPFVVTFPVTAEPVIVLS